MEKYTMFMDWTQSANDSGSITFLEKPWSILSSSSSPIQPGWQLLGISWEKPWSKLGSSSKSLLTQTVGFNVPWEKPWPTSGSSYSPLSQNGSHVSQKDLQPTLALAPILWSNNWAYSVCIGILPHKEWELLLLSW